MRFHLLVYLLDDIKTRRFIRHESYSIVRFSIISDELCQNLVYRQEDDNISVDKFEAMMKRDVASRKVKKLQMSQKVKKKNSVTFLILSL